MLKSFFKLILYFSGFVVLGAVATLLILRLINFEKTVMVPSLAGKTISEATGLLKDRDLFLEIDREDYSDELPPGHIIKQDVKQGEKVKKYTNIRVFVSKGKTMITTPYFEGMDINDVKLSLKKLGMEIGKITRLHSDNVEKDRVITQRPLPGYFSGNKVNLVVSLGPYDVSYRCPQFVDMTVVEARKTANALGLKLIERKEGRVIVLQKPEAGAIINKGDSVEVTLGRGWGLWF